MVAKLLVHFVEILCKMNYGSKIGLTDYSLSSSDSAIQMRKVTRL